MTTASDNLAIDLLHVTKVYRGSVMALQGITMRVRRGEVFGLLGPNGAGKSTLVKIMVTVVRPTRAEGFILGKPVGHKGTLAKVGYLPENHRFPRYLTGRQTLEFFGALAKVDRRTRRRRSGELLATVGMSEWGEQRIGAYSKGMMQRIGLAQALMNDPDLVILDEPTDGVDPVGRRDIRDVLAALRAKGKTVFVNSHLLSELELVCDRVAILVKGRVAKQGTLDELWVARQRYEIEVVPDRAAGDASTLHRRVLASLFIELAPSATSIAGPADVPAPILDRGTLAGGQWLELEGSVLRIGTTDPADVQPVLDALRQAGMTIRRVEPVRPSLEELFLETVRGTATSDDRIAVASREPIAAGSGAAP